MSSTDTRWNAARERLVSAAERAGVDPGIMAEIAGFESHYNPHIKSPQSSAYGYGQFTDDTWVSMIHKYGEKYGVADAAHLSRSQALASGLRDNPDLQMAMLAEHTKDNVALGQRLGGPNAKANVYALHNLGSGDGPKFLKALHDNPNQSVADVFTGKHGAKVISNNPSLYLNHGHPVTVAEAYARMGRSMDAFEKYAVEARGGQQQGRTQSDKTASAHPQAATPQHATGVLKQGAHGAEVETLQRSLAALGYIGKDGKPLAADKDFGANTDHALRDFQRAHGIKVDGKAGPETQKALTQAQQHPLVSEATHPAHGLYAVIGAKLPPGTDPKVIANVTMSAVENGITSADKLKSVDLAGNMAFLRGTNEANRTHVDLQAPGPSLQQSSEYLQSRANQPQVPPPTQSQAQTFAI